MIGIGVDLCEVDRMRAALARTPTLRQRVFTETERVYCDARKDPTERYAARFAAKEAVMKAMGVGLGACKWHEIEVARAPSGAPSVRLHGGAQLLAERARDLALAPHAHAHEPDRRSHRRRAVALPEICGARRFSGWWGAGSYADLRMIPVLTPAEMAAVDAAAPEPVEVLIERAGAAVAREALRLLGGAYGRRVVVLAGKGNNGADGRSAARRLERRGVRVEVIDALGAPARLPGADLVVDAAYGTGFRGAYDAPEAGGTPVLAVDIPSGVDGTTGEAAGLVLAATRTVTFAALKPGLLFDPGRSLSGDVVVADIGLDVRCAACRGGRAARRRRLGPDPRRRPRTSGMPPCSWWPDRRG